MDPLGEGELFAGDAEEGISMVSGGIPRIINRICEKTLLYAYQHKKRLVEGHIIRYATDHEMMQADMIKM